MKPSNETVRPAAPEMDAPGLGLRREHYEHLRQGLPVQTTWFEAITENYLDSLGRPRHMLRQVRRNYPVALHGVSLSIASAELFPLAQNAQTSPESMQHYLKRWRLLIEEIEPFIVSDHLCWTRTPALQSHDLLPVSYSEPWLKRLCENVDFVQSFLGRSIALENVSSYVSWANSEMQEWEFLNEVSQRTGCGILLDINNVAVNAHNHEMNSENFILGIRPESVWQYHIAGHEVLEHIRFDTHGQAVSSEVRNLYARALKIIGPRPLLLERDQDIPDLPELEMELMELARVPASIDNSSATLHPERNIHSATALTEALPDRAPGEVAGDQQRFIESLFKGKLPMDVHDSLKGAGQPGLNALQSMNVYRDSILSRLMEALEELYAPLLDLNDSCLNWFQEYIQTHPPKHYNLSDYGHNMSAFLKGRDTVASDIARLCFLQSRFFHGQRPGGGWIQAQLYQEKGVGISRNIALLSVSHSAIVRWKAWKEQKSDFDPEEEKKVPLIIFRSPSGPISLRELKSFEAALLVRLLRGWTLFECMQWLGTVESVQTEEVSSFFRFLTLAEIYRPESEKATTGAGP